MENKVLQTPYIAQPLWQNPGWYQAVNLTERIASQYVATNEQPSNALADTKKAERRLQHWKGQAPFAEDSFFAERLAMDSITEGDLFTLLSEPIEAVYARMSLSSPPDWLVKLNETFASHDAFTDIPLPIEQAEDRSGPTVFLQSIKPLLRQALQRLTREIQDLIQQRSELPFDLQTITSVLLANLPGQILPKLSRTLVLELNVARLRGRLQGETPEERFQSYIHLLSQPGEVLSLLEEYPVLARQLITVIDQWVSFSLEFVRHLCTDWEDIRSLFTPESDPGVLTEVTGGAGDTHRNGRSVMLLKFHSGFQLVYKPKSLSIDAHFQDLLIWLNERGQHPAFRTFKLIDRGTYGWSEFICASDCYSEEEVGRFYERQGGYLALLHVLEASDFHYENIIAAGEHPVLIDLEALFHPRVGLDDPISSKNPASKESNSSVLRIGLLPFRLWSSDDAEGVDVSGLGGQQGQLSPFAVPRWEDVGTDQMRLVRERIELNSKNNRPRLNGCDVPALEYCDRIVKGFSTIYRLLEEYSAEFLERRLACFAHDEIRFIARPTRVYALLLFESFHPNLLRDALKRERFLDRLWLAVKDQPHLARLIPAERSDMLRADIPVFTAYTDSRDLFTSRGERIPEFFTETSLERVKNCLQELNEEDLARQSWVIRASFASMSADTEWTPRKLRPLQPSHTKVTRERLVGAACAVGGRLSNMAVHSEDAVGWLGVAHVQGNQWDLRPADTSLYNGNSGIALFLSYLGHITGEASYTALARLALKAIHNELAELKKRAKFVEIGAFIGLGAPIYLFSHLAVLWNEPSLLYEAEELVKLLPALIEKDDRLDILAGSAGCIASLLSLYSVMPSQRALTAAVQCGERLLTSAQPMKVGVGWRTVPRQRPLTGFAHGTAGIAWSLLRLAELTGEERFRRTALVAMAYERSLFSPGKQNWPALLKNPFTEVGCSSQTEQEEEYRFMMSWFHGAPGIGLGRLASLKYVNDTAMRDDVTIALQTTIAEGFGWDHEVGGPNHSLSHGDFGNLETLLTATQVLNEHQYKEHLDRIAAMLLDSIDANGCVTGVRLGVETPGLLAGLAGIGYELLRLAQPEEVPSVLLLAPPFFEKPQGAN